MLPSSRKLLICGTRSLAEEVADLISDLEGYEISGFVENLDAQRCKQPLLGLPVIWVDDLPRYAGTHEAVVALGTTLRSKFTEQVAAAGVPFATIIHPTARIARTASVGEGTIVSAGVIVAAHTRIGRHVLLNRGVLIGHHSQIGEHCSIMPGANIAGNTRIGPATYVGMSAVVLDNLTVGGHCVIAAGALVTKDLPDRVQAMGFPAKITKENIAGK
jgi:sugar O-acyltransferase (sialic acid O-acetyltransferase NeuD family)